MRSQPSVTSSALSPADDLADQARPLTGPDLINVPIEDIPLPPSELVDQLDNSGAAADDKEDRPEVATLEFVGDELPEKTFQLRYPFKWQGARVGSVTVRQLSTAEVGRVAGRLGQSDRTDLFDLYSMMTGLPAPVLRAMPATDTDPIVGQAFDFLPLWLRPAAG